MGKKWIIDVLTDLYEFADRNDLPLLAHQLEVTVAAARNEIATKSDDARSASSAVAAQPAPQLKDTG